MVEHGDDGKRMSVSHALLNELDRTARDSLGHERPEEVLIAFYEDLWRELKQRVCTSAGLTGVSEYLFCRAITFMLEDITGEEFLAERVTKDACLLQSGNYILTHDLNLQRISRRLPKARTDIAIFSRGTSAHRLVGAFELKLYVSGPRVLREMFERLDHLAVETDSLLFPVLCQPQYVEEVDSFCSGHGGRAAVIGKRGVFAAQVTLRQAVESVVETMAGYARAQQEDGQGR